MKSGNEKLKLILAENIRNLRHCQSLSQDELAAKSGLHRTYISSVERCERNVTLSTLEMLATALGVSAPKLLEKRNYPEPAKE